jgi:hypothetical protein
MLRRIDQRSGGRNGHGYVWLMNTLDGPGFTVREAAYCPSATIRFNAQLFGAEPARLQADAA